MVLSKSEGFLSIHYACRKLEVDNAWFGREKRNFKNIVYFLRDIYLSSRKIIKFHFLKLLTLDYHFIIIDRGCAWFKNNWAFDIWINNKLFYTILIYTYTYIHIYVYSTYEEKIWRKLIRYKKYYIKISVEICSCNFVHARKTKLIHNTCNIECARSAIYVYRPLMQQIDRLESSTTSIAAVKCGVLVHEKVL